MRNPKPILAVAIGFMLLVVVLSQGCAHQEFRTNAYKTLAAGAAIYESGYPAFLELHQKGLISDAQKATGKELAIKYWAAYHGAVNALILYDTVQSTENEARVKATLQEAARFLSELSAYIQPFLRR